MVYELKVPAGNSPGILIFTHKERSLFCDPPERLRRLLEQLHDRYVFGMHWGRYHEDVSDPLFVDFHLAGRGTVSFSDPSTVTRFDLCSRNFIPSYFAPLDVPKRWEIAAVARPQTGKYMHELLAVVRRLFDRGRDVSVLLLCPVPDRPETLGKGWDREFFERYQNLFTERERRHIDLVTPLSREDLFPVPHEFMPYVYNGSRTFTLFSKEEGESRVIHEALLCGTPVVARAALRGGGLDYLEPGINAELFDSLDDAADAFAAVLDTPADYRFDMATLRRELCSEYTVDRFEAKLESLFKRKGVPYLGGIERERLSFKLPGHVVTLPDRYRIGQTNDLRSPRALYAYANEQLDRRPPLRERVGLTRDLAQKCCTGAEASLTDCVELVLSEVEFATGLPAHAVGLSAYSRISSLLGSNT